jgi:hypothetical protein
VLRRIASITLVVLGVLAIVLAVLSATAWRASDQVVATVSAAPDTPLVVTTPGVLDMVAGDVTITATAPDDAPVVLAIGSDVDVDGWVGDAAHVEITGLTSWTELSTDMVDGAAEVPNPAGSDMWVVQETGTGSATMEWSSTDGRWELLAATDGKAAAPTIALTWPQDVRTPYLVPGLIVGGVLVIAGVLLLVLDARRRATESADTAIEAEGAEPETSDGDRPADDEEDAK